MSIRKQYDTDLESLKKSLTEMGRNSADAVENALEALCVADADAAATIVKEDAIELYGFANELEQEAFELLISVSGVGPKMALALLSAMSVRELASAARDEGGRLQTAPGIGRKTAQRIALEVGEKLQELALAAAAEEPGQATDVLSDVIEGLLALGYPRADARRMAQDARKRLPDAGSAAALIKEALSSVSQ